MAITMVQEKQRIQQLINLDNQTDRQSSQYTAECLAFIQSHLLAFYERYADDTGLSLSQVNQRVSRWDMAQWKQAISQMGDASDWPDDAKQRMTIAGFIAGIDRSHLLDSIISLGIIKMAVSNQKNITHRVELDGKTEAKRMSDFFDLTSKQSKKVTSVITDSATTKTWSRNLWVDTDKMAGDVQYLVNQHLKHGMSLNDLNDILASHANPKQFKPGQSAADRISQMEFNARRIVRTESARLKDEANMTTYRMKGVTKVDWVCEPGACQKCQGIEEGSPYWINDAPGIPDDSHPNCRCSKIPHVKTWPKLLTVAAFKELADEFNDVSQQEKDTLYDKANGYIQTPNAFNINDAFRFGKYNELPSESKTTVDVLKNIISRHKLSSDMVGVRYMDANYGDTLTDAIKPQNLDQFVSELNTGKYYKTEYGFTSVSLSANNIFKNRRPIKLVMMMPKGSNAYVTTNQFEGEAIMYSGKGVNYHIVSAKIDDRKLLELYMEAEVNKNDF